MPCGFLGCGAKNRGLGGCGCGCGEEEGSDVQKEGLHRPGSLGSPGGQDVTRPWGRHLLHLTGDPGGGGGCEYREGSMDTDPTAERKEHQSTRLGDRSGGSGTLQWGSEG